MFETEAGPVEEARESAAPGSEQRSDFPPAPYFLLALGVGLFIGLALMAIGSRHR